MFTCNQIEVLSRIFSSKVFYNLTRLDFNLLQSLLLESKIKQESMDHTIKLGKFFDLVFEKLKTPGIRNEYIYKSAIAHKRLLGVHSLNTAVMLNEFRAGTSKADAVVLNGTSTVYEIKSERDSLSRLATQIADYQKLFSRVNVITSVEQVPAVLLVVPEHVGVLSLTNRYQISTVREASDYKDNLCVASIFNSLRREEARTILENLGVEVPTVPNTQMFQVMQQLSNNLDRIAVHDEMVKVLKASRSQANLHEFVSSIPRSVQAAALSLSMKKKQQKNFIDTMSMPLHVVMDWR